MSATTSISWTDKTWNPTRGCSVISPGCVNCYAMKTAHRFSGSGKPYAGLTKQTSAGPQWTGEVRSVESSLLEPLSWRKPARIFVNSMSDLFHESVADAFIDQVFAVMALAPMHTFQILTKRPTRMLAYLSHHDIGLRWLLNLHIVSEQHRDEWAYQETDAMRWTREGLPNVWLGVSVETQHYAAIRIPDLLNTPAAIRFVSYEPALGPVDFSLWIPDAQISGVEMERWLDWVIVGGESGRAARPFDVQWAHNVIRQCAGTKTKVFVKQLGTHPICTPSVNGVETALPYVLQRRKGDNQHEWPVDLQVQEFPQ